MCSLKALQDWCGDVCEGYSDVLITDMSSSFTDGLAFCAIIHKHRPDLLDFHSLSKHNIYENMRLAFDVAERELGIPALLDPDELVSVEKPDLLSIITYVSQLYCFFRGNSYVGQKIPVNKESSSTKTQKQTHTQFSSDVVRSSDKSVCSVCHTRVHLIQRVLVKGQLYHRSCFRCSRCRRSLLPISFTVNTETGSLQCSYPCKPASGHDRPADQYSQNNTSEMDRDRSEMDGDRSETDRDRSEMDRGRSEMDRDRSETDGDRSEADRDRSEMDRGRSEMDRDRSDTDGDRSETDRDRSEMDGYRGETDRDKSETDRDNETGDDRIEMDLYRSETDRDRSETDRDMSEMDGHRSEMDGDRSETDRDRSETDRDRSEMDGQRSETDRDMSEMDGHRSEMDGDRSETDRDRSETDRDRSEMDGQRSETDRDMSEMDGHRSETDGDRSETDRDRSEMDGHRSETDGDRSETDRDRSEMDGGKSETDGDWSETDRDRSETDEDKMDNGRLSTSLESDIQEPPKPAPRKRAEPQDPLRPTPRSPDHRPENVSSQSTVRKEHPWMKLVDPGPWSHLPAAPSSHSRHWPMTFNPFLQDKSKDKEKNPTSCEASVAHKASSSVPSMHQTVASVHGFPLIKRKVITDTRVSEKQVCVEQKKLEERLLELERRGVQLETEMRRCTNENLLVDWFLLVHEKSMLVRRDTELVYMVKQQRLEDQQADVEFEIRRLFNKPEQDWSSDDRHQEHLLMSRLLSIIQQRNDIISSLDQDRQREKEEDTMLTAVIQRMEFLTQTDTQLDKCSRSFKRLQMFKKSSCKTENTSRRKKKNS
ncbi:MICAL-like protein 1 isoform X2 [Carassius gibelio]|uniref:MICAL-like protein 1 isoform X2 n=1 Tax=Carassius gibelio TaxID=101364 RepID=UPI00227857F7|nr:MICAL-like protein 1 isoform X2 [Carassius gibelio]